MPDRRDRSVYNFLNRQMTYLRFVTDRLFGVRKFSGHRDTVNLPFFRALSETA